MAKICRSRNEALAGPSRQDAAALRRGGQTAAGRARRDPCTALRRVCAGLLLPLLVLLGLAIPGEARARSSPRSVAVFPLLVQGDVPAEVRVALQQRLQGALPEHPDLRLVRGKALRKRLKARPLRVLERCERLRQTASCLARVARRLRVDELLLGRAVAVGQKVRVLLLSVKRNRHIEPAATLWISSAQEVATGLNDAKLAEVFAVPSPAHAIPATQTAPAVSLQPRWAGRGRLQPAPTAGEAGDPARIEVHLGAPQGESLEVTPTVGVADAKAAASVADTGVAVADTSVRTPPTPAAAVLAGTTHSVSASTLGAERDDTSMLPTLGLQQTPREAPPSPLLSAVLRYGGAVLAVAGAGLLGYGGYLGYRCRALRQKLSGASQLDQVTAVRRYRLFNEMARQASTFLLAGTLTAGGGLSFMSYELFSGDAQ